MNLQSFRCSPKYSGPNIDHHSYSSLSLDLTIADWSRIFKTIISTFIYQFEILDFQLGPILSNEQLLVNGISDQKTLTTICFTTSAFLLNYQDYLDLPRQSTPCVKRGYFSETDIFQQKLLCNYVSTTENVRTHTIRQYNSTKYVDHSIYIRTVSSQFLLKFIYSEKATKFWEIFTSLLTGTT